MGEPFSEFHQEKLKQGREVWLCREMAVQELAGRTRGVENAVFLAAVLRAPEHRGALANAQRSATFLPRCVPIGAGTFFSPAQRCCEPSAFPPSLEVLQVSVKLVNYILLSWV